METAKDKAKELFNKFMPYCDGFYTFELEKNAKQCAILCCEEIMNIDNDFLEPQEKRHIGNVEPSPIHIEFWFKVIEEINKL